MSDFNWADFKPAPDQPVRALIGAIEHVESGGDDQAVSSQGATGAMQIMPATFQDYALPGESFDNAGHRRAAAIRKIVDDYRHFGGDMARTAAAYIGGRGAVRADGTIRDDVADANGTTPVAYAQMVLGRVKAQPAVDWSQFEPAPQVGAGRGFTNPQPADPAAAAPRVEGATYQPEVNADPETSTGGPELLEALRPQAGSGRGFVNPEPAVATREVGVLESFGRGAGRAGAQTALVPSLLVSAAGVAWDKLHGLVSGREETGAQDAMFRNLVDPRQEAVDWYALGPEEHQGFLGKVADSLGAMAQDLPLMIASGGAKQRVELAQQFPTMARYLQNAFSAGFDAMRPIMVKAGTEKAKQVLDAGGTTAQAMNSATAAALWTGLTGAQPMSAEGTLLQRLATGIPVGMAQEEGGRVVQNAADPAALQRPFDAAEMVAGGLTNAVAAGALPHGGPVHPHADRIDLGYDPLTGKTPVAQAVAGMGERPQSFEPGRAEPARDPVADLFSAPTVEAAVQAAARIVDEPSSSPHSVADEMRTIRPQRPPESAEGAVDERLPPDISPLPAGGDRGRSAEPGAGLDVPVGDDRAGAPAVDAAGDGGEAPAGAPHLGNPGDTRAVADLPRPRLEAEDPIGAVRPGVEASEPVPFRRGDAQAGPGAKLSQIGDVVSNLTRDWLRKPDIHVLDSMDEAPEPVRRVFEQQNSQGAYGDVEGFHWRGGVYLMADALHSREDVQRVLYHEALGHFGLRGVFGDSLSKVLNEVAGSMPRELARKAEQYGFDLANQRHRQMAAEEVLAELAQTRPDLGIVRRAVAAIRTFLRAHGIDSLRMTQDEIIRNYILPARGWVERGKSAEPSFAAPAASAQFSRREERPPRPFYSALARGVEGIAAKMQGGDGWRAQIDGLINKGLVKRDEVEWSGLNEWLRAQDGRVTKQQVLDYLAHNGVQVSEVTKRDHMSIDQVRDEYVKAMVAQGARPSEADQMFREMRAFAEDRDHSEKLKDRGFNLVMQDGTLTGNEIHDAIGNADGDTKYGNYTLPGGQNYRELLLTLPQKSVRTADWLTVTPDGKPFGVHATEAEAKRVAAEIGGTYEPGESIDSTARVGNYFSAHWNEPNIVAHVRLNDRTDAEGRRTLFVEELQSDWAQQARKQGFRENYRPEDVQPVTAGDPDARDPERFWTFRTPDNVFQIAKSKYPNEADARDYIVREKPKNSGGVARAPFVDSTDKWLPLALKRIVKLAADEGYDRVAFVNGEQSADRYDLSQQVDRISYAKVGDGRWSVDVRKGRQSLLHREATASELEDLVGKDVAKKIVDGVGHEVGAPPGSGELHGLDLKVGGEGMKAFYDKIVPAALNKLLPRLGGERVGEVAFLKLPDVKGNGWGSTETPGPQTSAPRVQPGFDVTPKMREHVAEGVPMFSRKGTTAATAGMPTTAPTSRWERSKAILSDLLDEGLSRSGIYHFTAPMSEGSVRARAVAQNFANAERLARHEWQRISDLLQKRFTPEQRRQMWEAADEQNTVLQQGQPTTGRGLDRLSPEQRDVVEQLHTYGEELLQRAKDVGMFQGEGLPYWSPRMMVMIDEHGEYTKPVEPGKKQTSGGDGRNVVTTSSNLKQRKYLTAAETEAAMKAKGGELVRDIMTMPLAMSRLERAIAGRELVNQIKELGRATGTPTVATGRPDHEGWFTLDHNAFTTFQPRFEKDPATGKMKPLMDEHGEMVFDRVPLYMSKEFQGPVKAILSNTDGTLYRAFMLLKSKAMSAIMFSPLIHNMVIFGRAVAYSKLPIVQTLPLYFRGHAARQDNALMRTALEGGLVPMGYHSNGMIDVTDVARGFGREGGLLDPNESWIAHGAGFITKAAFGKVAGAKVKDFIDRAGDFWHGTLLWERVADIQMGIFAHAYEQLQAKGFEPGVAKVMAAHWANRYAGAIARENMGEAARKAANVLLFSRSFNFGNLGAVKDLLFAMPSGLRAKIEAEYGRAAASQAFAVARRKAWAGFARDYALYLIAGGVASAAIDRLKKDKGWDEIFGGYVERAQRMADNIKQHPFNPGSYSPNRMLPSYDNEPGKQDRVDVGEIPDQGGRHEYMRLPTGKVVEDTFNWIMHPTDTFTAKMSPLAKSVGQVLVNNRGFGVPVFEPSQGFWKSAAHVAEHLAKAQTPWDTIVTVWDKLQGKTTPIENDKLVGNVTGFTFSQGHPQGPEAGVAAQVEDRIHAQRMLAMEEVKRLLKYDKEDEARQKLEDIGLAPREVNSIIKRLEQPKDGMSRNQQKRFNQHGTEEDQRRMDNVTR